MIAILEPKQNGIVDMVNRDTLAWRLMLAREDRGLKQNELVDILRSKPYGIDLSYPGYSKIESGTTKTPRHEILIALSEILEISLDELIAGKAPQREETTYFFSSEAEEVANIIDGLDNDTRAIVVSLARQIQEVDTERRELHGEVYELLRNNENTIKDSDKPKAKLMLRQMKGRHSSLSNNAH